MSGTLHIGQPKPGVILVEIDCPPANALGHAARVQFAEALTQIDSDTSVRAAIITGRGKGFCAGDDLREATVRGNSALDSLSQFGRLLDQIEGLRVPVIAAVNGHCIGGGLELALACDIRIASPDARFIAAGVNVGLMASVYRLPRLIGVARAKTMILTGIAADSTRALADGLVTDVAGSDDLLPTALGLASHIASRAPLSVEASKRMIGRAFDLTPEQARAALAPELQALAASSDHAEGVAAFAARRPPEFKRR
jgi:enoyl-CoA hydratase